MIWEDFGMAFPATFSVEDLDGSNGFRLDGVAFGDQVGADVAGIGDVNGDGVDDLMLSGTGGDGDPRYPGATYVIYGSTDGFAASIGTADHCRGGPRWRRRGGFPDRTTRPACAERGRLHPVSARAVGPGPARTRVTPRQEAQRQRA